MFCRRTTCTRCRVSPKSQNKKEAKPISVVLFGKIRSVRLFSCTPGTSNILAAGLRLQVDSPPARPPNPLCPWTLIAILAAALLQGVVVGVEDDGWGWGVDGGTGWVNAPWCGRQRGGRSRTSSPSYRSFPPSKPPLICRKRLDIERPQADVADGIRPSHGGSKRTCMCSGWLLALAWPNTELEHHPDPRSWYFSLETPDHSGILYTFISPTFFLFLLLLLMNFALSSWLQEKACVIFYGTKVWTNEYIVEPKSEIIIKQFICNMFHIVEKFMVHSFLCSSFHSLKLYHASI
jgi:hypothetical protein